MENAFSYLRVSQGVLKKSRPEKKIPLSFICVCKYLNQRVGGICEQKGKKT